MDSAMKYHVPDRPVCRICIDSFTDPVILECKHKFCSPCLCLLWENLQVPAHCPVCQASSQRMDFKSVILSTNPVPPDTASAGYQLPNSAMPLCRIHLMIMNLVCEGDNSLVCLFCSISLEHSTHRHWPINQVAEYYREKILMQMKSIWKKKQKNQRNLTREIYIIKTWKIFLSRRMLMIWAEYPKVYQYLGEEKQRHLDRLREEGKMFFPQLKESKAKMAKMRKLLNGMYQKLKQFYYEPDELLLQGVEDILRRSEEVKQLIPQPLNPQLSSWPITGMSERLDYFRECITLDPETCRHQVFLLRDLRNLQYSYSDPDVPRHLASSESTSSWGAQTFMAGKHYWEVNIGNSQNWIVGFCKNSWAERSDMRLDSKDLFLFFCVKVDDHFHLFSTSPILRHYIQRPQRCIGVFLDYECGLVSFINVAQSSLIFSFLSQFFTFPLRPFIFYEPDDQGQVTN